MPTDQVPEGTSPHGSDLDVELWPGETVHVDTAEAAAAARRFRDVLARFATGVTVITACDDGEPVGMTCQSFMSVSLEPPLVAFSPARTARAWPRIRQSGGFCVNFLAAGQAHLSVTMSTRGADKFAEVGWRPAPHTGSPVLDGGLGYVDCRIEDVHEAGDHWLVLGRVVDLGVTDAEDGLTFFEGRYGSTG